MAVNQEGLRAVLETYFGGASSKPATLYVGLCSDAAIAADAALTDLTEVTGSGYARQTVTNDTDHVTSAEAGTDDWKVTLDTVTFTPTGTWTEAVRWFLATTNDDSGKLLANDVLTDGSVILEPPETLDVPIVVQGNG